ncbi:hypothetical protein AB0L13_16715 [Saccharopolyspora shandongensis]|uniref:hypothetical protein n=1 Tax=Saccharopolyspora shandongensis TaxID=418495 RepID=UPI0034220435
MNTDTCDACRAAVRYAIVGGAATAFDRDPHSHGDHTIHVHPTKRHAIAVKLRPNQIPGARRAGQSLYQLHRRSCTKALSSRRR